MHVRTRRACFSGVEERRKTMRKPVRVAIALSAIALVGIMLAVPFYTSTAAASDSTGTRDTVIYTVGGQDQMKTRNWLPSIANDVWTSDVLGRVYDTVGQTDPVTDELVPYIIKGIDVDGDGTFQRAEKGGFLKGACPLPCADEVTWRRTVVAYYDFNGVLYHDNVQADIGDVMFNYVMQSINPRFNTDLRVLWDDPNAATFPASRHLNIDFLGCGTAISWDLAGTLPGDNNLRCALRYRLQDDFALFYGVDPNNPAVVLDPDLPTYIHQPFVDAILFKIYRTTQLGVLALESGEIDFYHWALPPEFVPDLLNDPNVRVWANAEPGFFYMAYNMRRQPFGYTTWPPPAGMDRDPTVDTGLPFRQ